MCTATMCALVECCPVVSTAAHPSLAIQMSLADLTWSVATRHRCITAFITACPDCCSCLTHITALPHVKGVQMYRVHHPLAPVPCKGVIHATGVTHCCTSCPKGVGHQAATRPHWRHNCQASHYVTPAYACLMQPVLAVVQLASPPSTT